MIRWYCEMRIVGRTVLTWGICSQISQEEQVEMWFFKLIFWVILWNLNAFLFFKTDEISTLQHSKFHHTICRMAIGQLKEIWISSSLRRKGKKKGYHISIIGNFRIDILGDSRTNTQVIYKANDSYTIALCRLCIYSLIIIIQYIMVNS